MHYIGIIPARYASSRFPGKPLAMIGDKTMIERVYIQAKKAMDDVVVATDDQRIFDAVRAFGGEVVMTSEACRCGTERCWECLRQISVKSLEFRGERLEEMVVINIQGDEPFIQPEQIETLKECFKDPRTEIATLVKPFTEADGWEALENPNTPKVAVADGRALLFSRSIIPYLRGVDKKDWLRSGLFYKHIGMYAYRADILEKIVQLVPTPLEQAESLEQLRWIENGYTIRVGITEVQTIGIDTPEDLALARAKLEDLNGQSPI